MTKKFIHTNKEIYGINPKNEFIIPDIFYERNSLIGIDSNCEYKYGRIVYTGVELDENKIIEKITKKVKFGYFKKRRIKKILNNYLSQIKKLKVGDDVFIDNKGNLKTINLKNKYVKLKWEEDRLEGNDNWGKSTWYFELDFENYPVRQIEYYENGIIMKYSKDKLEDNYGRLGDQPIIKEENTIEKIKKNDFEILWKNKN